MRHLLAAARPVLEDLAGTLAFYLLYLATRSARIAAILGLAIGIAQIGWHVSRRRPVPMLLVLGVALTAVLGALTLFTRDARFLLVKPGIVYLVVGAAMLPRGWARRYVPAIAIGLLPARTIDRVGWGWAGLVFATAVLNLVLVAALPPRRAAAVFALAAIASKLALFAGQYVWLRAAAIRAYRMREGTRG